MAKTFQIKLTEDELKCVIHHNVYQSSNNENGSFDVQRLQRAADLQKRLDKDTPEVEVEVDNKPVDPQPALEQKWG